MMVPWPKEGQLCMFLESTCQQKRLVCFDTLSPWIPFLPQSNPLLPPLWILLQPTPMGVLWYCTCAELFALMLTKCILLAMSPANIHIIWAWQPSIVNMPPRHQINANTINVDTWGVWGCLWRAFIAFKANHHTGCDGCFALSTMLDLKSSKCNNQPLPRIPNTPNYCQNQ